MVNRHIPKQEQHLIPITLAFLKLLGAVSKCLVHSIAFNSPQVWIAIGISAVFNSKLKSQKCSNISDFLKSKNLLNSNRISESILAPFTFHTMAKFTNTVHSSFFTNTYAKVLPDLSVAFLLSCNFSMVT